MGIVLRNRFEEVADSSQFPELPKENAMQKSRKDRTLRGRRPHPAMAEPAVDAGRGSNG
jgi:hypothetical protein